MDKEDLGKLETPNTETESTKTENTETIKKGNIFNYLKFGYITVDFIIWGIFVLCVLMFFAERYYFANYMWYQGMEMTLSLEIKGFLINKYYRYISPILRIIVFKLILEYLYQLIKSVKYNSEISNNKK